MAERIKPIRKQELLPFFGLVQEMYSCIERAGVREYCGKEDPMDFGRFSLIYNTLKRQDWFMSNASTWLLLNSDDSDDPTDFSEEDLLAYNRSKAVLSA